MMYTFYQSVYYAFHNKSFPSTSEEKHAFWVSFGEHVGDSITQKLLDSSPNMILYRSAVCPADNLHPNKHLLTDLGEPDMIYTKTAIVPCYCSHDSLNTQS